MTLVRGPGTCFADEGTGGDAGTQIAGGDGGLSNGESGTLGQGGGAGGGGSSFYGPTAGAGLGIVPRDSPGQMFNTEAGGGGGSNLLFGSGTATISNSGPSVSISYQGGLGSEQQRCTVTGTRGSDTLQGTGRDDVICGRGGADTLMGAGGEDVLRGGGGPDALMGGPGSDQLLGGAGTDALHAVDRVRHNDIMNGGADRDSCRGDRGDVKQSCR